MSETAGNATGNQPQTPRGVAWLDAATAAGRMGVTEQTIRRRCADEWSAAGRAVKRRPARGGKAAWHVREDADRALSAVKFPEQIKCDLTQLTEAQRRELAERQRILREWGLARAAGPTVSEATDRFVTLLRLKTGRDLKPRTLYEWQQRYRDGGAAALLDGRSARTRPADAPAHAEFLDEVLRLWLSPNKLTLKRAYKLAMQIAAERSWPTCSYFVCNRARQKLAAATVAHRRGGDKAFTDEAETHIERDYSTLASNEQWCGDSHRFDVMVDVGGGKVVRPWLTAWQDMRSRKIVAWQIFAHDPNEDAVIAALAGGIRAHGVPQVCYIDNGKDWTSRALTGHTKRERREARAQADYLPWGGIFGQLGIHVVNAQPYHGQSKTIERFFGTMEEQFGKLWPTYCGRSTAEKPHGLSGRVGRGLAPALAEFAEHFGRWLEGEYHQQAHGGDAMGGASPDQVYVEQLAAKRVAPAELLDLLLMKATRPVTIGQNGVTYRGLRYGRNLPRLLRRQGERVILRTDPSDVSFVIVCGLDGKVICRAGCNQRLPVNASEQLKREAIAEKRRVSRAMRQYHEVRPRLHHDLVDVMARKAAAARRAEQRPDLPPPSIVPVRSPLESQLPAFNRAMQRDALRPAVGAESSSALLPSVFTYTGPSLAADRDDDDAPRSALDSAGEYLQRHGGRASED